MPFTLEQFRGVFRDYNAAIWPAQGVLIVLALGMVVLARRARGSVARWGVPIGLALLWAWTGGVYQLVFFTAINPAAYLFGNLFLLQAVLWIAWARRRGDLSFNASDTGRRAVGGALAGYGLIVYPLLNLAFGHTWPAMPTFGAPCPTVIVSLGFLAWASPRPPWWIWPIPIAWAAVGTSAALHLGMREDLGLPAAAVAALVATGVARRRAAAG